ALNRLQRAGGAVARAGARRPGSRRAEARGLRRRQPVARSAIEAAPADWTEAARRGRPLPAGARQAQQVRLAERVVEKPLAGGPRWRTAAAEQAGPAAVAPAATVVETAPPDSRKEENVGVGGEGAGDVAGLVETELVAGVDADGLAGGGGGDARNEGGEVLGALAEEVPIGSNRREEGEVGKGGGGRGGVDAAFDDSGGLGRRASRRLTVLQGHAAVGEHLKRAGRAWVASLIGCRWRQWRRSTGLVGARAELRQQLKIARAAQRPAGQAGEARPMNRARLGPSGAGAARQGQSAGCVAMSRAASASSGQFS
ncbi:unnamed protein product, partial [Prorocentrum cordatum]